MNVIAFSIWLFTIDVLKGCLPPPLRCRQWQPHSQDIISASHPVAYGWMCRQRVLDLKTKTNEVELTSETAGTKFPVVTLVYATTNASGIHMRALYIADLKNEVGSKGAEP